MGKMWCNENFCQCYLNKNNSVFSKLCVSFFTHEFLNKVNLLRQLKKHDCKGNLTSTQSDERVQNSGQTKIKFVNEYRKSISYLTILNENLYVHIKSFD